MAREGYPLPLKDRLQEGFWSPEVGVTDNLDVFRLEDLLMVDLL